MFFYFPNQLDIDIAPPPASPIMATSSFPSKVKPNSTSIEVGGLAEKHLE
jgi:hypothetical protein